MTERIMRRRENPRGFTTIEMIIVAVIIGLMAAAVMPRISRIVAEERIRKLQGTVATDFEVAFALANRERKPVKVTYSTSTQVLTITDQVSNAVLKNRYLGRNQDFSTTGVSFSPSEGITIFPGGLSSASVTVILSNGGYSRTVLVTRAGMVTKS